ncbi:hypothetical protein KI387_040176, partial [Taxus chinensis]
SNLSHGVINKHSRDEEDPKLDEEVEILDSGENQDMYIDVLVSSKEKVATNGDSSDEVESEKSQDSADD